MGLKKNEKTETGLVRYLKYVTCDIRTSLGLFSDCWMSGNFGRFGDQLACGPNVSTHGVVGGVVGHLAKV